MISIGNTCGMGSGGSRGRTRLLVTLLLVTCTAIVLAALGRAAVSGPQAISADPFTDPTTQHQTEAEVTTEASGRTIIAAYSAGRGHDGGGTNVGWATSLDGGATWSHGFLPGITRAGIPPGPYLRGEDTSVAFDTTHNTWLIESS